MVLRRVVLVLTHETAFCVHRIKQTDYPTNYPPQPTSHDQLTAPSSQAQGGHDGEALEAFGRAVKAAAVAAAASGTATA